MLHIAPHYAALIPIGCGPFVGFILTICIVGFVIWLVRQFGARLTFIDDWFRSLAIQIIFWAGIIYICLLALDFVFGIRIINVSPLVCG